MSRTTRKTPGSRENTDLGGGFLSNLTNLIETLGELAEKGKELQGVKEFGSDELKGVYGFTIRSNLGGADHGQGVKVEPFGNVRTDEKTGRVKVHEVIEPPTDVFEEPDHLLVVAELPGVGSEDVTVDIEDDILTVKAQQGKKKYQKEILLPASFKAEQMTYACRNGMLEIRLQRETQD